MLWPDSCRRLTRHGLGPALLLAVLLSGGTLPAQERTGGDAYQSVVETILCDCGCHPQSIEACACGRAAEMRSEVAAMVERGMSGEAIIADYVARNGEQIRIAPTATGFNLIAWLGPLALLLVATAALLVVVRRLAARASSAAAVAEAEAEADKVAPASGPAHEAELDRLDRALEDWS